MAADGHVVGVEGLSRGEIGVHVAVHRGLHHLQIGVGPATAGAAGQRQTVADALIVVAQIGVSGIAVIVVVGVVVPRGGLIAQRAELVAQRQRHIVVAAGPEADVVVDPCGQQAGEDGKFAAGGGLPPAGLVVVGADEALVGQTVQRRGQLLGDEPRRKGLRRQQDQILALEHPGILVLPGGSARRHIAVDGGQRAVGRGIRQRGEVDVQRVVAVDHRLRRDVLHRFLQLGQRGQRRRGGAGQGIGQLQTETAAQTELGHGAVGVEVVGVEGGVGTVAEQRRAAADGQHGEARHDQQRRAVCPRLRHDTAAQDDGQHRREHGQQDKRQARQDDLQNGGGEVAHHMAGHGDHEGQSKIGFEVALAAVLHTDEHRPQERQAQTDPADGLAPWQQAAQQAQQQTAADRRQRDGQQRPVEKHGGGIKGAEQQLMVQQRQREKDPV